MAHRSCKECRIETALRDCRWVNERNAEMVGRCATTPEWGGACATCDFTTGVDPAYGYGLTLNGICRQCLRSARLGSRKYFTSYNIVKGESQ